MRFPIYETSTAIVGSTLPSVKESSLSIFSSRVVQTINSQTDSYITIYNQSTAPQPFYVVADPPIFTSNDKPDIVYSPIYQSSARIADGTGTATFVLAGFLSPKFAPSVHVITGLAHQKLEQAAPVFPSDHVALNLFRGADTIVESSCTITIPANSEPTFSKEASHRLEQKLENGEVLISTDDSFDNADEGYPFIGLGLPNRVRRSEIMPLCIWEAMPSTTYKLKPSTKWHCYRGDPSPGQFEKVEQDPTVSQIVLDIKMPGINLMAKYNTKGRFESYDGTSF